MPSSQPHFDILINGQPLGETVKERVAVLTVDLSVEAPSMFTIDLAGSPTQAGWANWMADDMFWVGNAVEVKMGYRGGLETLLKGEITALEPSFVVSSTPRLAVRGFDRGHRLQRRRRRHTFTNQKASDIAAQIARGAGLAADCVDSGAERKYVIQENRTDWEFLRALARDINYEVFVDDKTLVFRPAANDAGASARLRFGEDLTAFHPRLSLAQQVSEVSVRGWSEKEKRVFVGQARAGDEGARMGRASGPQQVERAFGRADVLLSARPVRDQDEADQLARARLREAALALVSGEGTCPGRMDLRAGRVIRLDGLGQRFSGNYYVTSAIHRYDRADYTTVFTVRRNAT